MSTIAKALSLLDLFSEAQPRIGLTEIQRETGRDKATVHRHLVALERAGYLEQDPRTRAYCLGPALTRLSAMRARTVPEAEQVRAVVDRLSKSAGELVHLSRLRGFELEHVYHAERHDHPVRVSFEPFGLPPLLSTASGKAYLAFCGPDLIEAAFGDARKAAGDLASEKEIRAALAAAARRGFAQNQDKLHVGVSSVAIPVFDGSERPFAACAIAFPTARGGAARATELGGLLMSRGVAITRAMGGVVPTDVQNLWSQKPDRVAS